jgi:hypothetical protein
MPLVTDLRGFVVKGYNGSDTSWSILNSNYSMNQEHQALLYFQEASRTPLLVCLAKWSGLEIFNPVSTQKI